MHRRPFTSQDAYQKGKTASALKHAVKTEQIQHVRRGIYIDGSDPPTPIERALAIVVASKGVASGSLAAILYGLDAVSLHEPFATIARSRMVNLAGVRRADLPERDIIEVSGYPCTSGLRTLIDLAVTLTDTQWEQALESALRKNLCCLDEFFDVRKVRGTKRIHRVLSRRPSNAPATESLLETLMVQLIRRDPRLPTPQRQVEVYNTHGIFIARVDLAWPEYGVFLELDGQQHRDQPLYDASRQTAVVAATKWHPGRFTWHEITQTPRVVQHRLRCLLGI